MQLRYAPWPLKIFESYYNTNSLFPPNKIGCLILLLEKSIHLVRSNYYEPTGLCSTSIWQTKTSKSRSRLSVLVLIVGMHLTFVLSNLGSYRRWPITHNSRWVRTPWKTVELQHECHNQSGSHKQMGPQQRYFSSIFLKRQGLVLVGEWSSLFDCRNPKTHRPPSLPPYLVPHLKSQLSRLSLLALYFAEGDISLVIPVLPTSLTSRTLVLFWFDLLWFYWMRRQL